MKNTGTYNQQTSRGKPSSSPSFSPHTILQGCVKIMSDRCCIHGEGGVELSIIMTRVITAFSDWSQFTWRTEGIGGESQLLLITILMRKWPECDSHWLYSRGVDSHRPDHRVNGKSNHSWAGVSLDSHITSYCQSIHPSVRNKNHNFDEKMAGGRFTLAIYQRCWQSQS